MKSKIIWILFMIMCLTCVFYVISNRVFHDEISNLLSPIATLSAGALIFTTVNKGSPLKISWVVLGVVALFWGAADTLWMILYNLFGQDPLESNWVLYLYVIPNLGIAIAGYYYFFNSLKRWHQLQLVVDAILTLLLIGVVLGNSYLKIYDFQDRTIHENLTNMASLLLSSASLLIVIVLMQSVKTEKLSKTIRWFILGFIGYTVTDFAYLFADAMGTYEANAFIDTFYVVSIVTLGIGSFVEWLNPTIKYNPEPHDTPQNVGSNYRIISFMIVPIVLYYLGVMEPFAFFPLILFLALYMILGAHIQKAILSEGQLISERIINEKLEQIVEERTKSLRASYEEIEKLAITDSLSGLYNRRHFMGIMDQLIQEGESPFHLYYLDLDHFKVINDVHGHEMGDEVLRILAKRFKDWKPEGIFIARVGGDEFGIIQKMRPDENQLKDEAFCNEIIKLVSKRIEIGDYIFDVACSIGISRFPIDGDSRDALVKYADLAMYQAKKISDRNKFVYYSRQHGELVARNNRIEMLLKTIDYGEEMSMHYQPQFDLMTGELIGAEALIRWNNPEMGFIPPDVFIPISESTGSIIKLGKWIIETVFSQMKSWETQFNRPLKVGINLSPLQFDSSDFFPFIADKIKAYGIDASLVEFEITENSAMNSGTIMEEIFTGLSGLGIQIAVDDFGTGYSSLSYIKRFDIDRLKIAKELIDHIEVNHDERLIIKAIILMARGMGLLTIAEGVENEAQRNILRDMGCDAVQGYFYSKPLPVENFEQAYLKK